MKSGSKMEQLKFILAMRKAKEQKRQEKAKEPLTPIDYEAVKQRVKEEYLQVLREEKEAGLVMEKEIQPDFKDVVNSTNILDLSVSTAHVFVIRDLNRFLYTKNRPVFRCPFCPQSFSRIEALEKHKEAECWKFKRNPVTVSQEPIVFTHFATLTDCSSFFGMVKTIFAHTLN